MFISLEILRSCGWQAFERIIARLLIHKGFRAVRVVGGSGDKGADILGISPSGSRWLIQAKYWQKAVPESELRKTVDALNHYRSDNAVVVALNGIDEGARQFQKIAISQGHKISVWLPNDLVTQAMLLPKVSTIRPAQGEYQESAIRAIVEMLSTGSPTRAMVVMATGLGKTFTAAEAIRRVRVSMPKKVLIIAHTNQLLLQLERSFWPFLGPTEPTVIWNQNEKPGEAEIERVNFLFASRDSLSNHVQRGGSLQEFDLVLIDECHHANSLSESYQRILTALRIGGSHRAQLLGLTATPFMADPEARLDEVFGVNPLITIDMIYGLRHGFLSQIDYRLFTDNIDWDGLRDLTGQSLSPRVVNRHFFVQEYDLGVINMLQATWGEVASPKAIIFCGTIDHAIAMRNKINARGFCHAEAIHSGGGDEQKMSQYERNLVLTDFEAGIVNVICTVDVFNEGIDVPDVNIVVFNRITHSRRIFIQQLGRGLRVAQGKSKAIILDFAQDIRRYAAGIQLKDSLERPIRGTEVSIGNKVVFRNATGTDQKAESFLRAWLSNVEAIEGAGDEQTGVLEFPPAFD